MQPKHLVLTSRNFPMMTRKRLRENVIAMTALRRSVCFKKVLGGCASVECTWAKKGDWVNGVQVAGGFHLHSHWLIEARWIDLEAVESAWAKLIGQELAVVRVYDARQADYVKELCKYVVEGSELAGWPKEIIHQFVCASRGVRFFFKFGELLKQSKAIQMQLACEKKQFAACECGCDSLKFKHVKTEESREEAYRRQIFIGKKRFNNLLTHTEV